MSNYEAGIRKHFQESRADDEEREYQRRSQKVSWSRSWRQSLPKLVRRITSGGNSSDTSTSIPEHSNAPGPVPDTVHGSPSPPRLKAFVEVFDDVGPRAQIVPGWANQAEGGYGGDMESMRNVRDANEWSTRAFPSAREFVPHATPLHDVESPSGEEGVSQDKEAKVDPDKKSETVEGVPLADPAPDLRIPEKNFSTASRFWASFSYATTFCIPNKFIRKDGEAAKQAWREKVATCFIALLASVFFVGVFGFVPLLLCQEDSLLTWDDIYQQNSGVLPRHERAWTVIHGTVYDVRELIGSHPGGSSGIIYYLGRDASKNFLRTPLESLPDQCRNNNMTMPSILNGTDEAAQTGSIQSPSWQLRALQQEERECPSFFTESEEIKGLDYCHDRTAIDKMGKYTRGTLAHTQISLGESDMDYIIVRDRVYNVTQYVNGLKDTTTDTIIEDSPNAYLTENLHRLITVGLEENDRDATDLFERFYGEDKRDEFQQCLDDLFFDGVMNAQDSTACRALNGIMYFMLIFVAAILILQCLCSLLYIARRSRTLTKEMLQQQVAVMVPCYNEGDKELKKTINSVIETEYPDDNKVLVVVADGLVTGRGESMSTPETLAKILGFQMDKDKDTAYEYKCIGSTDRNAAFVYHGTHKQENRELKFIVIVKCGAADERSSPRAGNRGKRDSQLIITGMFNRLQYGRRLSELDIAICEAFRDLKLSAEGLKYLMAIDADTRVHPESTAQMIYSMEKDERILACCGETKVDNKAQSWVTMIQVYEYYSSHHLKKAFESVFGCVTCLPGCFTMYRIKSDDDRPLLASDYVFARYARNDIESLHDKNLYHLGEDRMLTTLLLQHHSDMKLSFIPEAVCWTIVPHTFKILLSQRRRWINSTLHNMFELLKVPTMCGICFISMKTVVVFDMIATAILPASMVYACYFVILVIVNGERISETIVLVYAIMIGCQVIIFLLRSRWDYLLWFVIYSILGVPIFYFFLPLYAFWHMDDLSWGQTRQVEPTIEKEPQEVEPVDDSATDTTDHSPRNSQLLTPNNQESVTGSEDAETGPVIEGKGGVINVDPSQLVAM